MVKVSVLSPRRSYATIPFLGMLVYWNKSVPLSKTQLLTLGIAVVPGGVCLPFIARMS